MKRSAAVVVGLASLMLVALEAQAQSAYFQAVTNLNPMAYWPLQETTLPPEADVETNLGSLGGVADAYYSSTNVVKDFTPSATTDGDPAVYCNGGNGSFLAVPMTDQRVSVPEGPFTVEAWVRPANYNAYVSIISQAGSNPGGLNGTTNRGGWVLSQNYLAYLDSQGLAGWSFHVYNGAGAGGGLPQGGAEAGVADSYQLNQWYYLVGVFDGTNCTLYVDGTNTASGALISSVDGYQIPMTGSYMRDTWDPLCIGCGRGVNGNRFAGGIDEVAVYTNALTPAQIEAHYLAASSATSYASVVLADNPYMYWRMDNTNYSAPAASEYPVAANYGSGPGLDGLFLSGTTPGVSGPPYATFGSPSYACAFNGLGTDSTNTIPVSTNGVAAGTTTSDSGILISNVDSSFSLASNTSFTVMCWFKGNPADNRFQALLGQGDHSWRIAMGSGGNAGKIQFNSGWANNPGDVVSPAVFNDGNWHFAAGVSSVGLGTNGTNLVLVVTNSLYVDGVLQGTQINTNAAPQAGLNPLLGGAPDYLAQGGSKYNQRFFAGSLAQVAYFTNALAAGEIQALYSLAQTPPAIQVQPAASSTAQAGQTNVLTVAASGASTLTYQWYFNTSSNYTGATALTDTPDGRISGTTTETLTVTNLGSADSGYYYVVVNNSYGSVTSSLAQVTVVAQPVITAQSPTGAFDLFAGQQEPLSVTATGAPVLSYQWLTNGVADPNGTNATYLTAPAQVGMEGETYQCIVANSYGTAPSTVVTLQTVQALPANVTSSEYATNVLALHPTVYYPMNETAAPAPGDIETNYGTLGALGTAYYADWNVNGGFPDDINIAHQIRGALANDSNPADYFLNRTYSYMLVPHIAPQTTLTPPFTIECWVNAPGSQFGDIISQSGTELNTGNKNNAYGFRMSWGGKIETYGSASGVGSSTLSFGQWYYVALTYDGTNMDLYVDGSVVSTKTTTSFKPDSWDPLTIGAGLWNAGGPTRRCPIAIDEMAVYTNVLDSSTIYNHYESGVDPASYGAYNTNVLAANPVLYYRMDASDFSVPPTNTWPVMTNYGTVAVNGVYTPGTAPGSVPGPNNGNSLFATGLVATNAMPCNGLSTFAAAYSPSTFNVVGAGTPLSFSLWFKSNPSDARYQTLVSSGPGWQLAQQVNGTLQFYLGGGYVNTTNVYNDGQWHQVVVTYATNAASIYVDGVLDGQGTSSALTNPPPDTVDYTGIGTDTRYVDSNDGAGRQYAGDLCEFAFWNGTALTPSQVQTLYNAAAMPPSILTQPVSARVNQGANFTNTVVATGSQPLTYQWYQNGQALSGQTNASLVFTPAVTADDGSYYVTVSNSRGTVTSATVTLTVNASPLFTRQYPVAYTNLITLFAGASPTFSVTTVGQEPITYQWFTNNVAIAGATNASLTLTNLSVGSDSVICIAFNSVGATIGNPWTLSVVAGPTAPYPVAVLADHPIGYWRLNEADDGLADGNPGAVCHDYVGGNDGIYTNVLLGQPGYTSGNIPDTDPTETSAEFTAPGYNLPGLVNEIEGIDFSAPNGSNSDFTISAWVNGGVQTSDAGIVTKGYGNGGEQFDLDTGAHDPSHDIRFFVRDAGGISYVVATSYQLSAHPGWHQLVGVCDESEGKVLFYIDGQLVGTNSIPPGSGILSSSLPMTVGARSASSTDTQYANQFVGYINDVAIFNYALSADQIQTLAYAAGLAPWFTQQPPTNAIADQGGTLTISGAVAAGSPPLAYQWHDAGAGNAAIPGQTSPTLVISNVPASYNDDNVFLTVTNLYGATNSTPVQITLHSGVPVIVRNLPPAVSAPVGHIYIYSIAVQGTEPFSYQWNSNGVALADETNSTYVFSAASGNYSVVITNVDGAATSAISVLTAVPLPTSAYAKNVLTTFGAAGYWPLQETNAPVAATMETNYGTLGALGAAYYAGTNAYAVGVAGGNVLFDQTPGALAGSGDNDPAVGFIQGDTNSYLFVPMVSPVLALHPPLTFACWIKSSSTRFSDLMGNGGADGDGSGNWSGLRMSYAGNASGGPALATYIYYGSGANYDDITAAGNTLSRGNWHYCVLTYDGTNVFLYVDGNLVASLRTPMAINHWTPLTIGTGRWDGFPTRAFSGLMDEVAVYTNALTLAQIQAHYEAGTTAGGHYFQTVLSDHPLLYYRMDGVYTNPSPLTYPTALNFGSAPVQGVYPPGIVPGGVAGPPNSVFGTNSLAAPINGVFSCVDAGNNPAFNPTGTQPFTAMTWFKSNPADNRVQTIMGQGQNWAMNLDGSTGHVVWDLSAGSPVVSSTMLNDGQWHFVAGVYDGTNSYLFVDGRLDNSAPVPGGMTGESGADLCLGGDSDYTYSLVNNSEQNFAGALARAAFFTQALTAAQISQIYDSAGLRPGQAPSVNLSDNTIHYSYGSTLLSSTNVTGPYQPVTGAAPPTYPIAPTSARMFFRASNP